MKKLILILFVLIASLALAACGGGEADAGAAVAIESYLQALVDKNPDLLVTLSCAEWEASARLEADSFEAVTARLEEVSCAEAGTDGDYTLVSCTGSIVATYNDEDQALALDRQVYRTAFEGGEWRMCGYQQ